MSRVCFDYDPLLYTAAPIGETRSIRVVHRQSGDEYEFRNRTSFWGHHNKKAGGWLAEYNAGRSEDKRRTPESFDIFDVQVAGPVEQCVQVLKNQILEVKESLGAKSYYGYTGKGATFREGVAQVLGYKANRLGTIRPLHLDTLKEYLVKNHACQIVTSDDPSANIEADDACSIDSYDAWKKWKKTGNDDDKLWLAFIDKDYWQCTGNLYHTSSKRELSQGETFGGLYWDATKKEVSGCGRMWLYYQVMNGDDADNYFANSAQPAMKWADKSAYDILKDAKNDKEAWEALVKGYKLLYPSPKSIIGWRGFLDPKDRKILREDAEDYRIDITWHSMLQENFTLAKMLRWRGDTTNVLEVMDKLGVKHEEIA